MFKTELEIIKNKKIETENLLKKLNETCAPYDYNGERKNNIFYVNLNISDVSAAAERERNALENIIRHNELDHVIRGKKLTTDELYNVIENININDFYYAVCQYFPHNKKEFELKNMEYKEQKVHYKKLILILNCIWLLNHDEPVNDEIERKLYKLSESGETFVFASCKVTSYKNRNLKINFSDYELFEKFERRFNDALNQAEEDYKKRGF